MIKEHMHQWQPVSRAVDIQVDGYCVFVCRDCSAMIQRKMKVIKE